MALKVSTRNEMNLLTIFMELFISIIFWVVRDPDRQKH